MSIFDKLDSEKQQELYKNTLKAGDVFLKKFNEADHKKFFIIAGISEKNVFICSVFINSEIHPAVQTKPNILRLHIPLLKSKNSFLKHDSYANCAYPIHSDSAQITKGIIELTCKVVGSVHEQDLDSIQNALIDSGLLSEEQIELYFKIDH